MAILRMMLRLDRGETTDLRRSLDTPAPDRWLSTLADQEQLANELIAFLETVLAGRTLAAHLPEPSHCAPGLYNRCTTIGKRFARAHDVAPPYSAAPIEWDSDTDGPETGSFTNCPHCGASLPEMGMEHFWGARPASRSLVCGYGARCAKRRPRRLAPHEQMCYDLQFVGNFTRA